MATRSVSKAEVLDLVRRHIRELEKEKADLQKERKRLMETVYGLRELWSKFVTGREEESSGTDRP
jgi:predicted nuclease with TOPRIM domain